MNERKKLYRSVTDRMLCGVCGGIADYFSVDPTLVRLALVALTFMGFSGIIVYIIAALIIPEEPA
ncbi:MAG: PspC domain-containing protein [Butyricicoccus sp.]|nr:PspC domain-containing protein [Butyricicoccus sp.]